VCMGARHLTLFRFWTDVMSARPLDGEIPNGYSAADSREPRECEEICRSKDHFRQNCLQKECAQAWPHGKNAITGRRALQNSKLSAKASTVSMTPKLPVNANWSRL